MKMFLRAYQITFLIILISFFKAHSLRMNEYVNESVYGNRDGFLKNTGFVAGAGNQSTNVFIDNKSFESTNRNYLNLGFNINQHSNFSFNVPYTDPKESRESRVDSKQEFYSLSSQWANNWSSILSKTKTKGFYFDNSDLTESNDKTVKLNNLSGETLQMLVFYKTNENSSSVMNNPLVLKSEKDSFFFNYWTGFTLAKASGLDDLLQLNSFKAKQFGLSQVDSQLLTIGTNYNANWFWDHWYIRTSLGFGISSGNIQSRYIDSQLTKNNKESKSMSSTLVGISTGYLDKKFATGLYSTANQTTFSIDQYQISISQQRFLFYYSYFF